MGSDQVMLGAGLGGIFPFRPLSSGAWTNSKVDTGPLSRRKSRVHAGSIEMRLKSGHGRQLLNFLDKENKTLVRIKQDKETPGLVLPSSEECKQTLGLG